MQQGMGEVWVRGKRGLGLPQPQPHSAGPGSLWQQGCPCLWRGGGGGGVATAKHMLWRDCCVLTLVSGQHVEGEEGVCIESDGQCALRAIGSVLASAVSSRQWGHGCCASAR